MDWNKITIEQFVKTQAIINQEPEDELDLHAQKKLIAEIITRKSIEEIENMLMSDIDNIYLECLTPSLPQKIVKRFKLNGVKYEFDLEATDLTSGRYMSIMESIKGNPLDNLHSVLFNIAHPIKRNALGVFKRYNFEANEVHKRIEDFKQMPIFIANPIAVFFCNLSKALTDVSVDSSLAKLNLMKREMEELTADLVDGVG
jgi:hypothetical protein